MITAVDTSVIVDVFLDDARYADASSNAVRHCIRQGRLVVCDVVWTEVAALFSSQHTLHEHMATLGIGFLPMNQDAASLAGELWGQYRARGGDRKRVIADFLIAAHAKVQCNRLLTRDRGFRRDYFGDVAIIDPMVDGDDAP